MENSTRHNQHQRGSSNVGLSAFASEPPLCIDSEQLLGQQGLAIINHQGQLYQLRQTKAGKLILTK